MVMLSSLSLVEEATAGKVSLSHFDPVIPITVAVDDDDDDEVAVWGASALELTPAPRGVLAATRIRVDMTTRIVSATMAADDVDEEDE